MEKNEKKNVDMYTTKEPTTDELKAQLMQAQQVNAALRMEAQKKLESMNYANAFQQQQFMLEIVKMKDIFPVNMVEKAIKAINNFWFEESKEEEINNEKQG